MFDPTLYLHLTFGVVLIIIAYGVTWAMGRFVRIMDEPNHRSSHVNVVPRAGGVSTVITFYIGLAVTWFLGEFMTLFQESRVQTLQYLQHEVVPGTYVLSHSLHPDRTPE